MTVILKTDKTIFLLSGFRNGAILFRWGFIGFKGYALSSRSSLIRYVHVAEPL